MYFIACVSYQVSYIPLYLLLTCLGNLDKNTSQCWCIWKQIIIQQAVCTLLWSIHNKPIHILDRFHKNTSHLKCYIPHLCHTRLTLQELKLLCFSSHHIRFPGRFSTICVASSKIQRLSDQWPIMKMCSQAT